MSSARTGHATYYLDVGLVSQNQAGNYSTYNIHIYAIADGGWSGYANGIGWSSYGNSGTFSFDGTSAEIANYNVNLGHDANGYLNWGIGAHVNDTGTQTFGGPLDWAQYGSAPRIPKVPSVPGSINPVASGRTVTVNFTGSSDNGGSTITSYTVQYSLNGGAWTGNKNGSTPQVYTGLAAGSYQFRVAANNSIGQSGFRTSSAVAVVAGGKRMTSPTDGTPFSIMRRYNGAAWIDIAQAERYDGANWVLLTG
jgi:hypothetical protein